MRFLPLALLCITSLAQLGCVHVKPYQRELLSEHSMDPTAEREEDRFRQHWQGSREGSEGGFSAAGGGCGCN
jgi:hypothetical protein